MKIKVNKSELLFLFGWTLFATSIVFGLTEIAVTNEKVSLCAKAVRYIGYLICTVKILITCIEQKKFFFIFPYIFVLVFSMYKSSNKTLFLYSLVFLAANNISSKKMMEITLIIQSSILIVTVLLSQIGVIRDYLFIRSESLGIYRHSLGFSWTTSAPILFFYCTLIYFYLKKDKIKIIIYILLECVDIWLYLKTNSRMAFLLSTLTILFMLIQKINKKRWKWISKIDKIFLCLPTFSCLISLYLFGFFNEKNSFWIRLNNVLSGRLSLGSSAIKTYGFSLFGQNIEWIGYSINKLDSIGYNYVDNSYLQLGLTYGVFLLCIVLIIYSLVMYKAIKIKDYYLACIVAIILIFSITEPRLMNLAFNPFPLLLFCEMKVNTFKIG